MGIDLAPFLVISVLLILIPGPDTAIVTKHALLAGRRGGVFAAIGVAAGLAIWTLGAGRRNRATRVVERKLDAFSAPL